jgi:ABC-2 type transport system ATP-binding protein
VVVEQTTDPTRRLYELTAEAVERGEELEDLEVRRPTLEDVYLELTAEPEALDEISREEISP